MLDDALLDGADFRTVRGTPAPRSGSGGRTDEGEREPLRVLVFVAGDAATAAAIRWAAVTMLLAAVALLAALSA